MKHYLMFGCLLLSMPAFAQKISESKVPAAVKAAFSSKFPAATGVKWEMEQKNYEAGFKENHQHISAVFDTKGTWMETETPIPATDLPEAARKYIARHYKGIRMKETARIEKADGTVNYEAEISGKDIIFDSKGTLL
ncbi:PepSY-like domain-containing protein [Chitinophaga eiseniae]|uniref:Putative beta-lactamase-inhibitor-like PepSY-like domain-containing protein n=1 Tax=Chitinophaga eiseniae TaxID=634771 RepID=A0A847SVZ1_9BACT|nr:PepSY-like domain-containing protein [Chitinophaga eiseniae]NLR82426.1 hypothetical protein [Chitinophaga eiseniae]